MHPEFPPWPVMIALDVMVLAVTALTVALAARHWRGIRDAGALGGVLTVVAGVFVIGCFYSSDLFTMTVMPLTAGMDAAMAAMSDLHSLFAWYLNCAGLVLILAGAGILARRYAVLVGEHMRDRAAVLEGAARMRQAVEVGGLGYYVQDAIRDVTLFCSPEHAAQHGLTPEEFIRRNSAIDGEMTLTHPDDREYARAMFRRARSGETVKLEYRVMHEDGGFRNVREVITPILDATGRVVRELGTSVDVTEQIEADRHLAEAQRLQAIGQLTGGIAHDFNNLMGTVIGAADLLEAHVGANREARGHLASIVRAVERGAALTHRLLAFGRQQSLDPAQADPGKLIENVEDILVRALGDGYTLSIGLDDGLWPVLVDATSFETVLLNLVINARDAMPDGGLIKLEARNVVLDAAAAARSGNLEPGEHVRIAVEDTGEGMAPEVVAKAFNPFFTTKPVGRGSGLGLSMVYGFAKQSGGYVAIESAPGEGTDVVILLPHAVAPAREGTHA